MDVAQAFAAASRDGLATASELVAAGVSLSAITKAARRGQLVRTAHGLYARAMPVDERARLAHLGTLSHTTAAEIHGFPLLRPAGQHVTSGHVRRAVPSGVRVHRRHLTLDEIVDFGGARVTSASRTALDCALVLPDPEAVVLLDHVLHQAPVDAGELIRRVAELRGPGSARARRKVGLADARAESPLESLARLVFRRADLFPELQAVVTDGGRFVARVDFLFADARLVVEADGFEHHADRDHFRRDRERQNALVALGFRVLRFTWDDLTKRPEAVIALVRRLLAAAS